LAVLPEQDDRLLYVLAMRWAGDKNGVDWLHRILRDKATALAGPRPSPLVLTLAVTCAAAWYEALQRSSALRIANSRHPDLHDIAYNRAFKRWMSAARTLATIQKIPLPTIVNIANQQQVVVRSTQA
jgi:hypothetical protein